MDTKQEAATAAPDATPEPGGVIGSCCACRTLTAVYEQTADGFTREVGWRCGNCDRIVPRMYERDMDALRARVAELEDALRRLLIGTENALDRSRGIKEALSIREKAEAFARAALGAGGGA